MSEATALPTAPQPLRKGYLFLTLTNFEATHSPCDAAFLQHLKYVFFDYAKAKKRKVENNVFLFASSTELERNEMEWWIY